MAQTQTVTVRIRDSVGFKRWAQGAGHLVDALGRHEDELPLEVRDAFHGFVAMIEEGWIDDGPDEPPDVVVRGRPVDPGD